MVSGSCGCTRRAGKGADGCGPDGRDVAWGLPGGCSSAVPAGVGAPLKPLRAPCQRPAVGSGGVIAPRGCYSAFGGVILAQGVVIPAQGGVILAQGRYSNSIKKTNK